MVGQISIFDLIARKDILSGNYEIETLDMLTDAFLKGKPLPKNI